MASIINIIYIIVSILSVALYVMSVQLKKKKNILITQIFASVCYLIVYVIKGAWSGVFVELLEQIKDISFIKLEKNHKKIPMYVLSIFIFLLVFVSIIFYDGPLSLLPLLINVILFVATYFKNPKWIRYSLLVSGALWGVYNLYVGAYIIVIGNLLEVVSAIISIVKYKDIDKKFA